jgi:hypothetical protein
MISSKDDYDYKSFDYIGDVKRLLFTNEILHFRVKLPQHLSHNPNIKVDPILQDEARYLAAKEFSKIILENMDEHIQKIPSDYNEYELIYSVKVLNSEDFKKYQNLSKDVKNYKQDILEKTISLKNCQEYSNDLKDREIRLRSSFWNRFMLLLNKNYIVKD